MIAWINRRFDQEGTLIIVLTLSIVIAITLVITSFFNRKTQDNSQRKNISGDDKSTTIINPQTHLFQGIYVRGATGVTNDWRAELGVFKEITTHLEIETGVGIKHTKEERNSAEATVGLRAKF